MRAVIYARRSTEEHQVESLETQLDSARRFCASRGWTVVAELTDTASRAEFAPKRRPGFAAARDSALAGDMDVLVTRDDSRLGGDMFRVATFAQELADADVKILFYVNGEELALDTETARLMTVMRGFASESERRKISSRTREHLERKARRGLVAGGMVYGYRNEPAPDGSGKIRVVIEHEAAIVRDVFAWYARGEGLRSIAKKLNDRNVPSPRAGKRGFGSWVPSAIYEMLRRVLYIGRIEWGRTHKTYRGGTKIRTGTHKCEFVAVDAPQLRIVPEELWTAVHARIQERTERKAAQRSVREKGAGRPASYLLSGILRCSGCGGPLTVANGRDGGQPIKVYTCCRRRDRGATTCTSTLRRDVTAVDLAVAEWICSEVMTEAFIQAVIGDVRQRLEERITANVDEIKRLERDATKLRADINKFAELALQAPAEARGVFFSKVSERTTQLSTVESKIREMRNAPKAVTVVMPRMESEARRRLANLAGMMQRHLEEARAVLRALFPNTLTAARVDTAKGQCMRLQGVCVNGQTVQMDA